MIEQSAHFMARSTSALMMAASSTASVAAIPSSSPASSAALTGQSEEVDLSAITSLHIMERKREEALMPTPIDEDSADNDRKYELKIAISSSAGFKTDALLSSTSSSGHSVSSDKLDSNATSSSASSSSSSSYMASTRIHTRMKALANYLVNNFSGLRKRIAATNAGSVSDVGRMRHYMMRRSAPNGTDRPKLNVLSTRHSGSELRTTLSWEDFGQDLEDVEEILYGTPKSRKRSRPTDIFQDAEVRALCHQCDVPKNHVDQVVKIVLASFGTIEMDVLMLEELIPENIVVFVGMLVFQGLECCTELLDLQVLPKFLRYVEDHYRRDMPFHNAAHAADVLHSLFMMLANTTLGDKISSHNQVGALLAAVMHDIEHTGLTNDFLIKTNHEIAQKFPTRAPMESKHIALAVEAITKDEFNILSKMSLLQQDEVLSVVRETILATALCYQRELLDKVQAVSAEEWHQTERSSGEDVLSQQLQILSLRCAMHVSDISQTMKPFVQHQKWVTRLTAEHFLQGQEDKRMQASASPPFCFEELWTRKDFLICQTGFLEGMALPAVATLNVIPWLDVEQLVSGVKANISEWTKEKAAL
ncbi:hypothetical protein Gpo141_00006622 [Globisporangium polare]